MFVWTDSCQYAFQCLKSLLLEAPVLVAPDFNRPFKLEVDASAVGVGAVLLLEDGNGLDKPVCYFFKKFNKHQISYSTIKKETLVLLLVLQQFEVHVGENPSAVIEVTV